jgi:hypothetical protein
MGTVLNRPASSSGTSIFTAVAFILVAILVVASPEILNANSAQTGVMLVGP